MDIFLPNTPVAEIVVRSVTVFFFLLLVMRLTGKRDVGEMSPSDLVLLLLLSSNVHTSLAGTEKSVSGGLIGAAVLIVTNFVLNKFAYRSKKFERTLKGLPEIVIFDGLLQPEILKRHLLTEMQVKMGLRKAGAESFAQVRLAVLELDGTMSVFKYPEDIRPPSEGTLASAKASLL